MEIIYLDCTDEQKPYDTKRRISDKYFLEDSNKEDLWLIDEELKPYSLNDCVLVRTTNFFPFNHEVHTPLADRAYEFTNSIYFEEALRDILKEKGEEEKYKIFSKIPRETIHFAINGLVQSHDYGNFEGRKFIIIEPLKYHIDESLLSIRPEDTFFKGNITLSNESVILMNIDTYESIKNDPNYEKELNSFPNIFVYSGNNEELAVKETLNILGYDSFLVSNNYFTNGSDKDYPAKEMTDFLREFTKTHSIPQTAHIYTDEYKKEHEEIIKNAEEIDTRHLKYILENSGLPSEYIEIILEKSKYYYLKDFKDEIKELINKIGLETLANLTKEFNQIMIEENDIQKNKVRR